MEISLKYKRICVLMISILLIMWGFFLKHNAVVVQGFYLIYSIIIFYKFSNNIRRYLYFLSMLYICTTSGNSKYVFVFLGLYFLVLLKEFLKNKNKKSIREYISNKYVIFFIVFLVYMAFSILIASNKQIAIRYSARYVLVLSILILAFIENNNKIKLKETTKFLLYFYIGILFLGFIEICGIKYGLPNIYKHMNIDYFYINRIPEVFYYNPNDYSVVLSLGIATLFSMVLYTENKKNKILYIVLILISEVEVIFARSRISWIITFSIFIIPIVFNLIYTRKDVITKRRNIKRSFGLLFLSFILFSSLAVLPSMEPYYGKFANSIVIKEIKSAIFKDYKFEFKDAPRMEIGGKGSENERFTLMYDVIDGVILKKNLLGFGVGNIGVYVKGLSNTYGIVNIHSFWFEFLGDFGIFMFIYLISIYVAMLRDMIKLYKNTSSENKPYVYRLISIAGIIVILAFAPSTMLNFPIFWITLGICFSLVYNKNSYLN